MAKNTDGLLKEEQIRSSRRLQHIPRRNQQNQSSCHKAMKMHLFITFCLLGALSAQEVTELTSCLTKEKNLMMDCKFTLTNKTAPPTCEYKQDGDVMGSTDSSVTPEPTFKKRANVTLLVGNICRLLLTGFSADKAKNHTCIIKQMMTATKSVLVESKSLLHCSAISMLFQTSPKMLLTAILLPVLLEILQLRRRRHGRCFVNTHAHKNLLLEEERNLEWFRAGF
ncbi:hypothetical protein SKAU_G00330280 [Synaphobranchus kaupii]|uniref:Uncharacterized protein n=1 Tax=Synaphobranchus kaupii TaxID=118154 RepID=A0A9Q1EQC5_SYNKA|nr:hypothetical protein SKAU_G00330280 [Synaphobranchus kaupii]